MLLKIQQDLIMVAINFMKLSPFESWSFIFSLGQLVGILDGGGPLRVRQLINSAILVWRISLDWRLDA
jgi:hypothetical protein